MSYLENWINKLRERRKAKHKEYIKRRAEEIFSVEEYNGQIWFFCNDTGMFPCSYLGLKTEEEILKLLNDIRHFYIETE